jgi:7-cyano-7-deazaguanine synthase in queuosine biosynthesis
MQDKRYVICGKTEFNVPDEYAANALHYHLIGKDGEERKVELKIGDIRRSMYKEIPERFHDLLEIATYVYCADQEAIRGQRDTETFGDNWRRHFHFVIPVRDLNFWRSENVSDCLIRTLGFLSDDKYEFEFVELKERVSFQQYLNFNENGAMYGFPEQVIMFSGGLDSLGGAIDEIINQKRRVVLVNHRPTGKLDARYQKLEKLLTEKASDSCKPAHIRVTVHKREKMNKEYTQRSRSFLFVSIGATISKMLGLNSVRFYENGIISLNLPICAQVVGGKATRTTHPFVIDGFSRLLTMVAGVQFNVENPFIEKTKAEVVELIGNAGCEDMIAHSISCTHTWEMTKEHSHCGTCSQCIDRRFSIIAAGMESHDPMTQYKYDIFTQCRKKEEKVMEDKTMYACYLERANQVDNITDCVEFLSIFPEAARVLQYLPGDPWQVAERVYGMYKRHSTEINAVVDTMLAQHRTAIRQRILPSDCLIRIVHESHLPTVVSAVSIKNEKLPANIFRRKGQAWQVRFNGKKDFIVLPTKGAEYICSLLGRPNENIPIIELMCGATIDHCNHIMDLNEAIQSGLHISKDNPIFRSIGKVADWDALRQYRNAVAELQADLAQAIEENDTIAVKQCEDDIAFMLGQINETIGVGKGLRNAQNKRKNMMDAMRNAVKIVISKIAETDKAFAEHLTEFVRYGKSPSYRPDNPDIKWEICPILNNL